MTETEKSLFALIEIISDWELTRYKNNVVSIDDLVLKLKNEFKIKRLYTPVITKIDTYKYCFLCTKNKKQNEFYENKTNTKDQLSPWCKECTKSQKQKKKEK